MIAEPSHTSTSETTTSWPVNWSAILVGALAALAVLFIFGLIGLAIGAHLLGPSRVVLEWKTLAWGGLIFNVCGAFFSFVAGGWVAGKISGVHRAETGMFQGAIVWVVAVPIVVFLAIQGAGQYMGSWNAALASNHPAWAEPKVPQPPPGTPADSDVAKARTAAEVDAAKAARNAALGVVAAMLLGLMGSVIGDWMASGEPMTFTYWRQRDLAVEHMEHLPSSLERESRSSAAVR